MRYESICPAVFLQRPNRFVAQVSLGGETLTCHVKNTGRCRELLFPGAQVWLQRAENPSRKTAYDLIAVQKGQRLINMDAAAPNAVFGEYLRGGGLGFFPDLVLPEHRHGDSRFDFYFEHGTVRAYAEVKGVTLEEDGIVRFPDAPTERGVKHLRGLIGCVREGFEAWAVFIMADEAYDSLSRTAPPTPRLRTRSGTPGTPGSACWRWTAWSRLRASGRRSQWRSVSKAPSPRAAEPCPVSPRGACFLSRNRLNCWLSIQQKAGTTMHSEEELYYHDHGDGHVHSHLVSHENGGDHVHEHGHVHPHTQTKAVLNRLSRAIGHLESVKRMVEDGRDCTEVLVQLAAVRSALSSTAKVILKDHLEHCVSDTAGGSADLQALNEAIDKFMN